MTRPCTVAVCTRPRYVRGLCEAHYNRVRFGYHVPLEAPIATAVVHDLPDCGNCGAGTNGYRLRGGVCAEWCPIQKHRASLTNSNR